MSQTPTHQITRKTIHGDDFFDAQTKTNHGTISTLFHIERNEDPESRKQLPSVGGTRFVTSGNENELAKLSKGMTHKCDRWEIKTEIDGKKTQYVGQKSLAVVNEDIIKNTVAKAELLRTHIEHFKDDFPYAVWGPDMNCDESVMDAVAQYLPQHVCGLSIEAGGYSIDQTGFTGFGVFRFIEHTRKVHKFSPDLETASVEGFGAVGAPVAEHLHRKNVRIVAISVQNAAIVCDAGLDIPKLVKARNDADPASRDESVIALAQSMEDVHVHDDPARLFGVPAHIFIPAARTSTFAVKSELDEIHENENAKASSIEDVLERCNYRLIAQAANSPLTDKASAFAQNEGVVVLTDFVINGGGLFGCWQGHERRKKHQFKGVPATSPQDVDEAKDRLAVHVTKIADDAILEVKTGLHAKKAASNASD